MPGISETGAQYSTSVGLIYVFNLIVGTGALTMPKAFHTAGWLLSLIIVTVLAFTSYLTVTFVTESMAVANAVIKDGRVYRDRPEKSDETTALLNDSVRERSSPFAITERAELGQMARMFYNKVGVNLFYLCMVIYLYGDLSIYAAAVPKSIRDVACTFTALDLPVPHNETNGTNPNCNKTLTDGDPCWPGSTLTRIDAYRLFVGVFFLCLGGFTFFNIQKTKYLQLFTTVSRWLAFAMMIALAIIRLSKGQGKGHPPTADISGVPTLFGVCVYSFMCHHSLPSLVTPIKDKSKLFVLLASDYTLILLFYALLSFTGIYAFENLNDIYTLNFLPDTCDPSNSITKVKVIQYFLALFPVFTLSTNFPIISITLRNNLKTIFYKEDRPYPWAVDRLVFPLLAIVPPMIISVITSEVEFLVGITGSYAGAGIQYIIPATMVYYARKEASTRFSEDRNSHASPFSGIAWIVLVLIWAILCIGFVTVNHIIAGK